MTDDPVDILNAASVAIADSIAKACVIKKPKHRVYIIGLLFVSIGTQLMLKGETKERVAEAIYNLADRLAGGTE